MLSLFFATLGDATHGLCPMERPTQGELYELVKHIGKDYQTIAIQFLGYSIEEIETMCEEHPGNISRVKFDILNGWLRRHPEGDARKVSQSTCHRMGKNISLHTREVGPVNPRSSRWTRPFSPLRVNSDKGQS